MADLLRALFVAPERPSQIITSPAVRTIGAVTSHGCELQTHYRDILSRLPIQCDDDDLLSTNGELTEVLLDRATVAAPPDEMTTDAIRLQRRRHDWMGWTIDQFRFTLDKSACRALGLLILPQLLVLLSQRPD